MYATFFLFVRIHNKTNTMFDISMSTYIIPGNVRYSNVRYLESFFLNKRLGFN